MVGDGSRCCHSVARGGRGGMRSVLHVSSPFRRKVEAEPLEVAARIETNTMTGCSQPIKLTTGNKKKVSGSDPDKKALHLAGLLLQCVVAAPSTSS